MTSITESQMALTSRMVNFMLGRPGPAAGRLHQCTVRRTRGVGDPPAARGGAGTVATAGSARRRPSRGRALPAEARLQAMKWEDTPADQLDLTVHVVLRALATLIGQRISRIPQRLRAEFVAARVPVKRGGQRVRQRDAVQHGPRRRPAPRDILDVVTPAAQADQLGRKLHY